MFEHSFLSIEPKPPHARPQGEPRIPAPVPPSESAPEIEEVVPPWVWRSPVEVMGVIALLGPDDLLGDWITLARGTERSVEVDPRELFKALLSLNIREFFLFHNHPSGRPHPSNKDLTLTRKVHRASRMLGLECLGHAILASQQVHWIQLERELPPM
jgi:hypothetical protein